MGELVRDSEEVGKRIFHLNVLPTVTNSQSPVGDHSENSEGLYVCVCVWREIPSTC